jgi:predicted chitinase
MRAQEFITESVDLPTLSFPTLYHVGVFDETWKRDNSFEGAGLSVSTDPDAWREIARGHVTGTTFSLTKQNNTFINAHKLTKRQLNQIKQWALDNGLLESQETIRVSWFDDEMNDTMYMDFDSKSAAQEEFDLDENEVEVITNGIIPTEKLKQLSQNPTLTPTAVMDYVLPIYAESLNVDGVWWQDTLNIAKFSAPRGVILPKMVKTWKVTKELNEGWKDTIANVGIAGAIAAAGTSGIAVKQALQDPTIDNATKAEIVQQVDTPPNITVIEPEEEKQFTGNAHEMALARVAQDAGINGIELAALLAQTAHESNNFRSMVEYGGSLDFRKYDPKYNPKKAKMLGNTKVGDGAKYKGRGLIQITGKYNYKKAGEALGLDLVKNPELAEKPNIAAKIAVWYWKYRVQPKVKDFNDVKQVTRPINSQLNGIDDRKEKFAQYKMRVTQA